MMLNYVQTKFQLKLFPKMISVLLYSSFSFLLALGCASDSSLSAPSPSDDGPDDSASVSNVKVSTREGQAVRVTLKKLERDAAELLTALGLQYEASNIREISFPEGHPDFSSDGIGGLMFDPQPRRGERASLRNILMTATTDDTRTHRFFYLGLVLSKFQFGHGTNGDRDGDGKVDDETGNNVEDKTADFRSSSNVVSILSPGGVSAGEDQDQVKLTVKLISDKLLYDVIYKNSSGSEVTLLQNSKLGLVDSSSPPHGTYPDFFNSLKVEEVRTASYYEKWNPLWGEDFEIENWFNELVVTVVPSSVADADIKEHHRLDIIFRVYDDGLGFRYRLRGSASDTGSNANSFRIDQNDEKTTFEFANSNWNVLYGESGNAAGHYEVDLEKKKLDALDESRGIFTPVSMKSDDDHYVSIHEAGLTPKEMGSMMLKKGTTGSTVFTVEFTSDNVFRNNAGREFENLSRATKPFILPWRTIQVAKGAAGRLIDSRLILNLNDPFKPNAYKYQDQNVEDPFDHDFEPTFETANEGEGELDTSWIRPGRYVGYWRGIHEQVDGGQEAIIRNYCWEGCGSTEFTLDYYRLADETGASAVLMEGWQMSAGERGWNEWRLDEGAYRSNPDFGLAGSSFSILDLFDRLSGRNVSNNINTQRRSQGKLPIYHILHTECRDNIENLHEDMLGTRRNEDPRPLFEEYRKDSNGYIRYLKGGYVGFRDAYEHWSQRWVKHFHIYIKEAAKNKMNVIIHEPIKPTGVRRTYPNMMSREGVAGEEIDLFRDHGIEHHSEVVYQRGLAGPIDWTPVIFTNETSATNAKQLALMNTLYAPLVMAAEIKSRQRDPQNAVAMEFVRSFHPDWSESRVLAGEFAEYVVIARRRRNSFDWVVSGITATARSVAIDLSDISEPGAIYDVEIFEDDSGNRRNVIKREDRLDHDGMVFVTMSQSGGFAMNVNYAGIAP